MPRIWRIHHKFPESLIGEYDRASGPDRFLLRSGRPLSDTTASWTFRFKGPLTRLRKFDDLANNTLIPLLSPRLASLLASSAPADIQLLPAQILARDGQFTDYQLLNVISTISGVDFASSDPVFIPGADAIMKFNRFRLVEGCLGARRLARCAEYLSYLLVADDLAEEIEQVDMAGMELIRPEDIHP